MTTAARGMTLPALFAAQALRTPDAVAVVFEDRALSYAALDAHANRLAHHLQGLGVGPETVVGLCVERSPEMVVGLLGILKAGGAYLPLDPNYPRERLAFMLADAGAPVLVTQQALLERLPPAAAAGGAAAALVRLDADWPAIARQPAHRADTRPRSRATPPMSSTPQAPPATPKGVVVEHASIATILQQLRLIDSTLQRTIAFLQFASPAFDASVSEIATTLDGWRDACPAVAERERRCSCQSSID